MGSQIDKLNYLAETKSLIKTEIENSGVSISEDTTFREYANKISKIKETGKATIYWVDADGIVVKTLLVPLGYVLKESDYPVPTDKTADNLIFTGWNINPGDIEKIIDDLVIGSLYTTTSGRIRIWVNSAKKNESVNLRVQSRRTFKAYRYAKSLDITDPYITEHTVTPGTLLSIDIITALYLNEYYAVEIEFTNPEDATEEPWFYLGQGSLAAFSVYSGQYCMCSGTGNKMSMNDKAVGSAGSIFYFSDGFKWSNLSGSVTSSTVVFSNGCLIAPKGYNIKLAFGYRTRYASIYPDANQSIIASNGMTICNNSAYMAMSTGAVVPYVSSDRVVYPKMTVSPLDIDYCDWVRDFVFNPSNTNIGRIGTSYVCTQLIFPEGVKTVSFINGYSMHYIEYPSTLTTIELRGINVTTIVIKAVTPPTQATISWSNMPIRIGSIYVPDESVEAYKTATNWGDLVRYIKPMSSFVTS